MTIHGKTMLALCALVVGSSSVMAGRAFATDNTVYPATECRFYGPNADDTYFDPNGMGANGLHNNGGAAKYAVCPIVRKVFDSRTGVATLFEEASIQISGGTTCMLYIRPWDGGGADILSNDGTYNYADGNHKNLKFFTGDEVTRDIPPGASAAFYCLVPNGGAIYSYKTSEGKKP